ncbi:MAG: HpcH/HpaI aldolase family protein [Candidatus Poribacteria bacterium]
MNNEELRNIIKDGGKVYGTMFSMARNPRWADVLVETGIDYVIIDTEHAPFSRSEVADMAWALNKSGIVPIVRVPVPSAHYVTMALDGGAQGILAPYCENVSQVKEVVGSARWRPLKGVLLDMAMEIKELPSEDSKQYLEQINQNNIVMIGIESMPALMNLEDMLSIDGIDVVFIGPNDLSISMGIPGQYTNPEFESAVKRVINVCDSHNVAVAIHLFDRDLTIKWIKEGVRFILYSNDIQIVREGFKSNFEKIRF